ncbi:MAG: transketolase, partial [Nitrospinales bacterium]
MRDHENRVKSDDRLNELAQNLRKDVLKMVYSSGEGHLGAAFSSMEILTTLYFGVMNIEPSQPNWKNRDRFIMSKGHGCFAQYAVLARRGFFPVGLLETISQRDTIFGGHPIRDKVPGVDVSTGSLGHGLSIGAGMALADRNDDKSSRVFVLLGDGECQEGSVWEAVMFASSNNLNNLIAIVDYNSLQAIGKTVDIISMSPFAEKWKSFGWAVHKVDGHDCGELLTKLSNFPVKSGAPTAIIARTIKGKGV